MVKILHFADAHIDMANHGRHDTETGLPLRVMDFLKSLDEIVDTAIDEKVELVLFAGDAYKDRNPAPTFQREWGKRIMRLANAGIETILLVGNHDLSPGLGRANALETFNTLEVPHVHVVEKPTFLKPEDIGGLPVQVVALPWVSRSGMMAFLDLTGIEPAKIYEQLSEKITEMVEDWMVGVDKELPIIMLAHASVQGAEFGSERTVMLGGDLVLSPSLVKQKELSYVALGHIHKSQDLNEGHQPPVIYSGSIERVDFGEAKDKKYFVTAEIEKGNEVVPAWRELKNIRKFIDIPSIYLEVGDKVMQKIKEALPAESSLEGAIMRLTLEYPREMEAAIDEVELREYAKDTFEFHLVKRPQMETRIRLPEDKTVGSLTPRELLDIFWKSTHMDVNEVEEMLKLAGDVISKGEDSD